MFGSVILDVAVGIILVYLLLSLVATSIREWISGILKTRANTLHEGMQELLGDAQLVADVYNHPVINSLYRGEDFATAKKKRHLPSYIPAKSFSTALVDMIVRGRDVTSALQAGPEARQITLENVRTQITRIQNVRVQRAVLSAVDSARGDLSALYTSLEQWFDGTMDRTSGWYKQHTQIWLFWIGLTIAAIADADTVAIARRLYSDPAQRQAVVAIASNVNAKEFAGDSAAKRAASTLASLGLPLTGWGQAHLDFRNDFGGSVGRIVDRAESAWLGWLITALAISLGAPFWFDTLGRIMVIRNTVKPKQKSPDEASDDRQGGGGGGGAQAGAGAPMLQPPVATTFVLPAPAASRMDFRAQEWAAGHSDAGVL